MFISLVYYCVYMLLFLVAFKIILRCSLQKSKYGAQNETYIEGWEEKI